MKNKGLRETENAEGSNAPPVFLISEGVDFMSHDIQKVENCDTLLGSTRISDMIEAVPAEKQVVAQRLVDEIVFMYDMLIQLRASIREKGPLDMFEQGKQKILRESPALKAYNTVTQRYGQFCKQYTDLLPSHKVDVVQTKLLDFLMESE